MDKITNKEAVRLIKDLKKRVGKTYKIDKAILFGSRARGDHLLDSDIDLVLISKDFPDNFHKRTRDVAVQWDSTIQLEPLCYTPEEFKEMKERNGIARQAAVEGIVI